VFAGSAPGTPVLTLALEGEACETGEPGDCGAGFVTATALGEPGMVRVKYQALPSATPRTQSMIMNGSIRFIAEELSKLLAAFPESSFTGLQD